MGWRGYPGPHYGNFMELELYLPKSAGGHEGQIGPEKTKPVFRGEYPLRNTPDLRKVPPVSNVLAPAQGLDRPTPRSRAGGIVIN